MSIRPTNLLTFNGAQRDDPRVLEWFADRNNALGQIAQRWFTHIRTRSDDVLELLHDGAPTACVETYPFAYIGVYSAHVNVGFFYGAFLDDPQHLLQGSGKRMRHVKLRPGEQGKPRALEDLIEQSYHDIVARIDDSTR